MNLVEALTRLRSLLLESPQPRWPESLLEEAIRQVLGEYNQYYPLARQAVLQIAESSEGLDLSALEGLCEVLQVKFSWPLKKSVSGKKDEPDWSFIFHDGRPILQVNHPAELEKSDKIHVWYRRLHTIAGLDGALHTTISPDHESILLAGAAGYAALARCLERSQAFSLDYKNSAYLNDWGNDRLKDFRQSIKRQSSFCWLGGREGWWRV